MNKEAHPSCYSNDPAFPTNYLKDDEHGLTKREYFAVQILQGILTGNNVSTLAAAVNNAVLCADLLIGTLNKDD